jgi:hypothetical protein
MSLVLVVGDSEKNAYRLTTSVTVGDPSMASVCSNQPSLLHSSLESKQDDDCVSSRTPGMLIAINRTST